MAPRKVLPLDEELEDLRSVALLRQLVREGRVRQFRESAGATQAELAAAVGCTPSAIAQYEAGRRVPRGGIARRYAAALAALQPGAGL